MGFGGAPGSKTRQKKISKKFTPTQNAKFRYLWNVSLKFPEKFSEDLELDTDQHTKRKK